MAQIKSIFDDKLSAKPEYMGKDLSEHKLFNGVYKPTLVLICE